MSPRLCFLSCLAVGLLASCAEPPPVIPLPPSPPVIRAFTVDRAAISPGEQVTLSWRVDDATSVTVLSDQGEKLATSGTATDGSATASPLATTFYVLRAEGAGGRSSAFVQVAVGADLRDTFLVAVPREVRSGEPVQLLWSAFGARKATLSSSGGEAVPIDLTRGSGIVELTPARTVSYSLVAEAHDDSAPRSSSAEVLVRPVLDSFEASRLAAQPGDAIAFTWKTRGAYEVLLTEATFGELHRARFAESAEGVDSGTFDWTVPAQLPSGAIVEEGQPLSFTLWVRQLHPQLTLQQTLRGAVGDGPQIVQFIAPTAVSANGTFELSWRTANAERLQILAHGGVVYEPLQSQQAAVASGAVTLKAPQADTTYELRAFGHGGEKASQTTLVRLASLPVITSFNLPLSVSGVGVAANATWTTQNAKQVLIRVKNGPTLFTNAEAAKVASGSTSIFAASRTTFVLEAYNEAGTFVRAEKTLDVNAPATVTAGPSPLTAGDTLTFDWALDPSFIADVVGDPRVQPISNAIAQEYYDLSLHVDAQELSFDDPDDDIARVRLSAPFSLPIAGTSVGEFWVSTNGFVAPSDVGARPTNVALTGTSTAPAMFAPFWDDLVLGSGKVYYYLEGTTFPRRLIIQWQDVKTAVDPGSSLSFQVQLFESGEVRYAYGQLSGTDASGQNASIGWRLDGTQGWSIASPGAPKVQSDGELVWFTGGATTGQLTLKPSRPGAVAFFARLASGAWMPVAASFNVIAPGSLLLNEAMVLSPANVPMGQWLELFNSTPDDVDLSGTVLTAQSSGQTFTFPEGTVVAANSYRVIGESVDPIENGGAPVDLAWTDFVLGTTSAETISLAATSPIASLLYDPANLTAGTSFQGEERAISSTGASIKCDRLATYGTMGGVGTPGAPNEACFAYRLTAIPVAFNDISALGTSLFAANDDDVYTSVDLSSAPFTYFGQPSNQLGVSTNGFVLPGALSGSHLGNKTAPSTTAPVGTIAPFWDDLEDYSGSGRVYAVHLGPGEDPKDPRPHWIIQWDGFSHYDANDDLNFQVKLFGDGSIEFHYASMSSGSSSNYANGNSATVWIERPAGDAALPIGINQPAVQPQSAWRFTPNP